uniref:ABC-type glutathione-S-conjugate transporter n=1 Tax=Eptatretus burgeri TaxID=7764 RepID=A0A8C4N8Z1_EPTBU
MDRLCGSPFWNGSQWDRPNPALTICFEQTVLTWPPIAFLWLCSPFLITSLARRMSRSNDCFSVHYMLRQILTFVLLMLSVTVLVIAVLWDVETETILPPLLYINPALYTVTWVLLLVIHEVGRRAGMKTSGVLFNFWLFSFLLGISPCWTLINKTMHLVKIRDLAPSFLSLTSFSISLIMLLISAFSDVPCDLDGQPSEKEKKSPEVNASFLNQLVFYWFDSLVFLGYRKPLKKHDLWPLRKKHRAEVLYDTFERNMRFSSEGMTASQLCVEGKGFSQGQNKAKHLPSLLCVLLRTHRGTLLESGVYKLFYDLLLFVSPQLLKLMIAFSEVPSIPQWRGFLYSFMLIGTGIFQTILLQRYFLRCTALGMDVRTTIIGALYSKSLVMSNAARRASTVGEVINLVSTDMQRFMDVPTYIHLFWSSPLQIVLSLVFLWIELGPAVLAGLAAIVLLLPVNAILASKSRIYQMKNIDLKDKRLKMMNDILNGIKTLKLYAWESAFFQRVSDIRTQEMTAMVTSADLCSISIIIFACSPFLLSMASFGVRVLVDKSHFLNAQQVFTSIALFNILRFPMGRLPLLVSSLIQANISLQRVEEFLACSELDPSGVGSAPSEGLSIDFSEASFCWGGDDQPNLERLDLKVKTGSLVAVVGKVGAGKSSLLLALLGEMERLHGSVDICGSIAYVPQQAWIQNASLRNNVLFGRIFEPKLYWHVLEACALLLDLDALPARDLTEIGEKGVNLSGGQKQRVSLARAIYSQADIFLLDNPLSAVDSHVGLHILQQALGPRGLLKDKTRVVVTHDVSFLPLANQVAVLKDGRLSDVGTYEQLLLKDKDLLRACCSPEASSNVKSFNCFGSLFKTRVPVCPDNGGSMSAHLQGRRLSNLSGSYSWSGKECSHEEALDSSIGGTLIQREFVEVGQVKWSVYRNYIQAMGYALTLLTTVCMLGQNMVVLGQRMWLSEWTHDVSGHIDVGLLLGVYAALGLAQGILVLLSAMLLGCAGIRAAATLHDRLLHNVMRLPLLFFDTTPAGRIANRFSNDIDIIDEAIPTAVRLWLVCLFSVVVTVFAVTLATPLFSVVVLPLGVFYHFVQRVYVASLRQLRRLDSVSRSPIYSHFGETLSGLPVIRASGHSHRFLQQNFDILNENMLSIYMWIISNRWLAIRLDLVGTLVVFFAALFAVLSRGQLLAGVVGVSITYALNVTQTLNWLVRQTSELETNVIAVERVDEYSHAETEAQWVLEQRPPPEWPQYGNIVFENYSLRYQPDLELVLEDITCSMHPAEKVGVVGRSGSGKSSLINGLFRVLEAAEGRILIDGIDISSIGLHDLRNQLTIIPQEPVLFSGSLRLNLDPRGQHSSVELWHALELAHLHQQVQEMPGGLDHPISEGGDNLSVGQKQLLCFARALLRRSRILVLDEATAAVDLETDRLIQETIRREFVTSTVITVAHRLHTVLDYSRIMVLDQGRIVEFDSPRKLMKKRGLFYCLAQDAGIVVTP